MTDSAYAAAGPGGEQMCEEERNAYTENGRFLKNPLPVPKRRAHVRMEFDLTDDWDIPDDQDHFDLEIAEDDDFDL